MERTRLQADVAKQRVRIAKEELKRARKRLKEAKREAKRARKQAAAAHKAQKQEQLAANDGGATLLQGFERETTPGTIRVEEPALARSSMSHWRDDLTTQMRLTISASLWTSYCKRIQNLGLRPSEVLNQAMALSAQGGKQ